MLKQRLYLAASYVLKEQFISHCRRTVIICNGKDFVVSFMPSRVKRRLPSYSSLCFNYFGSTEKPVSKLKDLGNIFSRLYSTEANVTFLSDGKSMAFADRRILAEDVLVKSVVEQLTEDNGINICVIETSGERQKYANYVIVVSGRSARHLKAMTNHLFQQSKKDCPKKSVIVTGLDSNDWMVIDYGSVVVHLFLPDVREKYELEKLWSMGPEHDEQYQAMLNSDRYADLVKNAKLEDFFVNRD